MLFYHFTSISSSATKFYSKFFNLILQWLKNVTNISKRPSKYWVKNRLIIYQQQIPWPLGWVLLHYLWGTDCLTLNPTETKAKNCWRFYSAKKKNISRHCSQVSRPKLMKYNIRNQWKIFLPQNKKDPFWWWYGEKTKKIESKKSCQIKNKIIKI